MNSNIDMSNGLRKAAEYFAKKVKEKLNSGGYPKGGDEYRPNYKPIQDTIVIGSPQVSPQTSKITVSIGGKDAPYAVAYEYGSGIHATRGEAKKYAIVPIHGSSVLVIPRSRWPNYSPPPDVDPVMLPSVQHPGVEAKPYIKPTIEAEKAQIKKILGQEFKAQILLGGKTIEVIK